MAANPAPVSVGAQEVHKWMLQQSWDSIRTLMATQQRVTLILPTDEQNIIYLRTTTRPEVQQQKTYDALCQPTADKFFN